jgi:K+-sensing histidine kinase KdpD
MSSIDPRWPKVLSLSVHEFRTPMTVVAGYIRMLLKDRAGALNDQQRRLLEEAEKSCARLSGLLVEVSELSQLEGGTATFNRSQADLQTILRDAVAKLPPLPDREVPVTLETDSEPAPLSADPVRLTQALASVIAALRRELIGDDGLVVRQQRTAEGYEVLMGEPATIQALASEPADARAVFDEWRGGVGLSLMVARRVIEGHRGAINGAPEERKSGARIVISKT